jgi:hypothetical protein
MAVSNRASKQVAYMIDINAVLAQEAVEVRIRLSGRNQPTIGAEAVEVDDLGLIYLSSI